MSGDDTGETTPAADEGPGQQSSTANEEIIDPTSNGSDGDSVNEPGGDSSDGGSANGSNSDSGDASVDSTESASGDPVAAGDDAAGDDAASDSDETTDTDEAISADDAEAGGTADDVEVIDSANDADPDADTQTVDAATADSSGSSESVEATDGGTAVEPGEGSGDSTGSSDGGEATAEASGPSHSFDPDTVVPVGVKLGSTRTVIALPNDEGPGIRTINTLTCLARYDDPISGEGHVLYGEEAAAQYPDRVQYMLRSGLPEDEASAETAATFFESVVDAHALPERSAVVYAIPTIDNPQGLRNLESVIERSGIGSAMVQSYPESLCSAIPAFGDDLEAISAIFIAVNMGSTNLEASAYRRGEQLAPFTTGAVTGNEVDRVIANKVEEETQGRVNIDTQTAREYKEEHADFEQFEPFTEVIQQPGGGAHEFTIERSIVHACDEYLDDAVEEFANTFLPELANDHMKVYQYALDQPIVLTGGMACIPGIVEEFQDRLSAELQREVTVVAPDRPELAATIGAQRIASRMADTS